MKRAITAALLVLFTAALPAQTPEHIFRTLSGTVTDSHHEPLKGAVVEVQNGDDSSVTSYLSDASGHFDFKRMNSGTDFTFWATYRGHRSKTHSISKFNSHLTDIVTIEIKLD